MDNLILDWMWLYIQIIILSFLIIRELIRRRNRNLFIMIISATMLFLVQGQAWWLFNQFQEINSETIRHLYQYVTLESCQIANLYTGLCVISLVITYEILKGHTTAKLSNNYSIKALNLKRLEINSKSYMLLAAWTMIVAVMLVFILGGLKTVIENPGTSVGGQTLLLIALSVGKIPLLHKISLQRHLNIFDILLFAITFFLTLFNSRFLTVFILGQVVIILNYCVKQISRKSILGGSFIVILIFLVFGLYRDNSAASIGFDWSDRLELLFNRLNGEEESPLQWFYSTNVEGFVGLAGILTYENDIGGITHDFGLSNLVLFTQFLPNAIRKNADLIEPITSFLDTVYPYPKPYASVVSPGLETAYAHFGLIGILFLGILLGYLANYFHTNMLNSGQDRLKIALLSVESSNLIRTMFKNTLFFGLGNLTALFVYRVILTIGKQRR